MEILQSAKDDMIGKKFSRLTVLRFARKTKTGKSFYECLCNCGKIKIMRKDHFTSGRSKSCGCLICEQCSKTGKLNKRHGHGNSTNKYCTPTYGSWVAMKARCSNPHNIGYKDYGGRGITVCERWLNFENFLADMGERPVGTSIDRIDNNKGYYSENCRWATRKKQKRNQRSNTFVTFNGQTKCIADWAKITGIPDATIRSRVKCSWPIERVLTITPTPHNGHINDGYKK